MVWFQIIIISQNETYNLQGMCTFFKLIFIFKWSILFCWLIGEILIIFHNKLQKLSFKKSFVRIYFLWEKIMQDQCKVTLVVPLISFWPLDIKWDLPIKKCHQLHTNFLEHYNTLKILDIWAIDPWPSLLVQHLGNFSFGVGAIEALFLVIHLVNSTCKVIMLRCVVSWCSVS